MGLQPSVDALDVERVAALRQQPEALVLEELAEAHRTVVAADQSAPSPVLAYRYPVNRGLVEPGCWRHVPVLVVSRLPVTVERAATAELGDDGVVADEEEGDRKDTDDHDD